MKELSVKEQQQIIGGLIEKLHPIGPEMINDTPPDPWGDYLNQFIIMDGGGLV